MLDLVNSGVGGLKNLCCVYNTKKQMNVMIRIKKIIVWF